MAEGEIKKAYCRTCKHWSVLANTIGLGNCLNVEVALHTVTDHPMRTAHNFGCILHERGDSYGSMYTEEQRLKIIEEACKSHWLFQREQL